MDPSGFDRLARRLSAARSRRATLGLVLALVAGARTAGIGAAADRCARTGAACSPKRANRCCSGTCRTRRGTFRCAAAPGAAGCTVLDDACAVSGGPLDAPACGPEPEGRCHVTTAGKPFCAASGNCFDCDDDRDCREAFDAPGARCVTCDPVCRLANPRGRRCVFADRDTGTIPG